MSNEFCNFEKEKPTDGYFLIGRDGFQKVLAKYETEYKFELIDQYNNRVRDGEKIILFYRFEGKGRHSIQNLRFER